MLDIHPQMNMVRHPCPRLQMLTTICTVPPLPQNPYAANSEQWVSMGELNAEFDKAKASNNYAGFPDASAGAHYNDIDIVQ